MKYIKKYESINNEPQIGDYVLCREINANNIQVIQWTAVNIGKYIDFNDLDYNYPYLIRYKNVPNDIRSYFFHNDVPSCRTMKRDEIILWSSNKEDLENIIKFNI